MTRLSAHSATSCLLLVLRRSLRHRATSHPPQQFLQRVVFSDGSTVTHRTTMPWPLLRLTRDMRNNPIWNPELRAQVEIDSGRMRRFERRYGKLVQGEEEETEAMEEAGGDALFAELARTGKA